MSVLGVAGVRAAVVAPASEAKSSASGSAVFAELLRDVLAREGAASQQATQAIQTLASGQTDNLHAVTLAVAQADLHFRLILELRNRFTEAYQEIMRMQI